MEYRSVSLHDNYKGIAKPSQSSKDYSCTPLSQLFWWRLGRQVDNEQDICTIAVEIDGQLVPSRPIRSVVAGRHPFEAHGRKRNGIPRVGAQLVVDPIRTFEQKI
jgi:hypothetical protein